MAEISQEMYRKLQNDFVSNLNGTSKVEVMFIVSSGPFAVLLRNALSAWIFIHGQKGTSRRWKFILDFISLVLIVQLSSTVWSSHIHTVLLVITIIIISLLVVNENAQLILYPKRTERLASRVGSSLLDIRMEGKRPFITHFRAYVLIATAVCILAVDFVVFPRRFCKAETYGTGIMDAGVGSFVISNAMVSPEARFKSVTLRSWAEKFSAIGKSVKSCLPLLVLGCLRVMAVKSTDYQEHVSEYGVHWNFFFTLAAVKILSTVFLLLSPVELCGVLGVIIALAYEYCLHHLGLKEYIILGSDGDGSRSGLLNANREGVCSVAGYLSIYLTGIQLGRFIFIKRVTVREWLSGLITLIGINIALWFILWLAETNIDPVSRRIANLQYIIWMHCYNIQLMSSFLAVDILWTVYNQVVLERGIKHTDGEKSLSKEAFCLLEAVNRNGLLYFLICNLLTGAVNFSMRTVLAEPQTAMIVITVYMFTGSAIMATLLALNISVKFW